MSTKNSIAITIQLFAEQFQSGLRKQLDGLGQLKSHLQTGTAALTSMASSFGLIGGAVGVGSMGALARSTATAVKEVEDLAVLMGDTVSEASKFAYAVQEEGVALGTLQQSSISASQALTEGRDSTSQAGKAFRSMGIDIYSLRGPLDLMYRISDFLRNDGRPEYEKLELVSKLLGKATKELYPALRNGADALRQMGAAGEKAGLTFDNKHAEDVKKFNSAMVQTQNTLRASFGIPIIEGVNSLFDAIARFKREHPEAAGALGLGSGAATGAAIGASIFGKRGAIVGGGIGAAAQHGPTVAMMVKDWGNLASAGLTDAVSAMHEFEAAGNLAAAEYKLKFNPSSERIKNEVEGWRVALQKIREDRAVIAAWLKQAQRENAGLSDDSKDFIGPMPQTPETPAPLLNPEQTRKLAEQSAKVEQALINERAAQNEAAYKAERKTFQQYLDTKRNLTERASAVETMLAQNAGERRIAEANRNTALTQLEMEDDARRLQSKQTLSDMEVKIAEESGDKVTAAKANFNQELDELAKLSPEMGTAGYSEFQMALDQLRQLGEARIEAEAATNAATDAENRYNDEIQTTAALVKTGSIGQLEAARRNAQAAEQYEAALKKEIAALEVINQKTAEEVSQLERMRAKLVELNSAQNRLARDPENVTVGMEAGFERLRQKTEGWGQVAANAIEGAADKFSSFISSVANGEVSFRNLGQAAIQFGIDTLKMINEMIIRSIILRAVNATLGSVLGGGGGGAAGATPDSVGATSVPTYAEGGPISGGTPGVDSVPILAMGGEYVQPVSSVSYYGSDVMEAIRSRAVPRDALRSLISNLRVSVPSVPKFAFATGGPVVGGAGASRTIIQNMLAIGDAEIARLAAHSEMRKAMRIELAGVLSR